MGIIQRVPHTDWRLAFRPCALCPAFCSSGDVTLTRSSNTFAVPSFLAISLAAFIWSSSWLSFGAGDNFSLTQSIGLKKLALVIFCVRMTEETTEGKGLDVPPSWNIRWWNKHQYWAPQETRTCKKGKTTQKTVMLPQRNVLLDLVNCIQTGEPKTCRSRVTEKPALRILLLMIILWKMTLLGTICYVSLLMLNAIAILNEDRFLARSKWHSSIRYFADAASSWLVIFITCATRCKFGLSSTVWSEWLWDNARRNGNEK